MNARTLPRFVAVAWLAVVALGAAGYAVVVAPAEREIRAMSVETASVYGLARRNERVLQRGAAIAAAAARVRRDLSELRGKIGAGKPTLALLGFLDSEARRRHVSFGGIVPLERTARDSGEQRVALALSGGYDDILYVISELSTQRDVVGIESVQLSRASRIGGDAAQLEASISATLFYGEASIVRSAQR